MKILLIILTVFNSVLTFSQDKIFVPNQVIYYAIEYFVDTIIIMDTIKITVTGNPWKYAPDTQKEIIITYNLDKLDTSVFRGLSSIGWIDKDTTGAVDNENTCWFHPPRHNQYKILELSPFPRVEYPLHTDKTYSRVLFIGDGWGDISNTKVAWKYQVTGYVDNNWTITSQAIPDNKPTDINWLEFTFNNTCGFKSLHYKFSNGTIIKMKKI